MASRIYLIIIFEGKNCISMNKAIEAIHVSSNYNIRFLICLNSIPFLAVSIGAAARRMKNSSEGVSFNLLAITLNAAIQAILSIFISVKSKSPTHPFYYLQRMNSVFFGCTTLLIIVNVLNALPLLSCFINCNSVSSTFLRLIFPPIVVTIVICLLQFVGCVCLLALFLVVETKAAEYFSVKDYYADSNVQGYIDSIQSTFSCCGKASGVGEWNGSVPSSCCISKLCTKYRQNWPCFPLLKYSLALPLMIGFLIILFGITFNLFYIFVNYFNVHFNLFSLHNEKAATPSDQHPSPPNKRLSPLNKTERGDISRQSKTEKKKTKESRRRNSPTEEQNTTILCDKALSEALIDSRRGSGYLKYGTTVPINKACDNAVRKRVCFSLPVERSKQSKEFDTSAINAILNRNLQQVMKQNITPNYLQKIDSAEDDIDEDLFYHISSKKEVEKLSTSIPDNKKPVEEAIEDRPRLMERESDTVVIENDREINKQKKTVVDKRSGSPIQALKNHFKNRKRKNNSEKKQRQ